MQIPCNDLQLIHSIIQNRKPSVKRTEKVLTTGWVCDIITERSRESAANLENDTENKEVTNESSERKKLKRQLILKMS